MNEETNFRELTSTVERCSLVLHYLASGEMPKSFSFPYRMVKCTVWNIIWETCDGIYAVLPPQCLKPPSSVDEWLTIARGFLETWNMPYVIEVIDGNILTSIVHLAAVLFQYYRGFFSSILLAVCDARYSFMLVDIVWYVSNNDSGVLARNEMTKRLKNGTLNLPVPSIFTNCSYDSLLLYYLREMRYSL